MKRRRPGRRLTASSAGGVTAQSRRGLSGPSDLAAELCQRLGEDRLAVLVAAPLAHVGEMGLVRLGTRRVRRVLLVLPAGKPQRGQSQVSGTCASLAKLGWVSCPLEHQKEMRRRGADSPRSASPIGPAPTRLPRIALPLATVVTPCLTVPRSLGEKPRCGAPVYVGPNARPVTGVTASGSGREPHDKPGSATCGSSSRPRCPLPAPWRSGARFTRRSPWSVSNFISNPSTTMHGEPEQPDHHRDAGRGCARRPRTRRRTTACRRRTCRRGRRPSPCASAPAAPSAAEDDEGDGEPDDHGWTNSLGLTDDWTCRRGAGPARSARPVRPAPGYFGPASPLSCADTVTGRGTARS